MAKSTAVPDYFSPIMKPIRRDHEIEIAGWILTDLGAPGFITMKGLKDASGKIVMKCGVEGVGLENLSRNLEKRYRFKFVDPPICKL